MLSTKVHKARQLASHALPLTRRILSLGKGLLHKVTGLAGRLLGAVGRCVRQVTDYLLESKAVRLLLKLTMIVSAVAPTARMARLRLSNTVFLGIRRKS